jgi:hypothetical protein
MREVIATLIGWFGPIVVLGVIVLGSIVWSVTHWTAQQGETVSLFWGMVEYTKGIDTKEKKIAPLTGLPDGAYLLKKTESGYPLTPDIVHIKIRSSWLSQPADVVGFCLNETLAENSLLTPETVRLC